MANNIDQHEMLVALKNLALDLGRTPSAIEFRNSIVNGKHLIIKHFGSYEVMLQAAGLDSVALSKKKNKIKITNDVFNVDIEKHLDDYTPRVRPKPEETPASFKKCLFIPDFHAPWGDFKVIEAACRFSETFKPDYIVQLGDLYDMFSHSKFPTSKNVYMPKEEEAAARKQTEQMWKMLKQGNEKAECYQILGNHDSRATKRVLESMPSMEHWVERMLMELMSFDGVKTINDTRDELILPGNVMVLHGYLSRPGSHRDYNVGYNVVHGHQHSAHVMYRQIQGRILWEMNCGIAADINSKAFSYTPQRSLHWSRGFGALDELGPRFCPVY